MKEKNILYTILKVIIYPIFRLLFHPKIVGKENIGENGIIICGTHTSNLDAFLLVTSIKRRLHFFAKIELFNTKLKSKFFKVVGCIPVNRKTKNKEALNAGYKHLLAEEAVVIFPEGTINKTNELIMPFKFGAVKMAAETKKAIIPFAIVGKYKIFGKSVKIIFDKPYYLVSTNLEKENNILMQKVVNLIKENSNEKGK